MSTQLYVPHRRHSQMVRRCHWSVIIDPFAIGLIDNTSDNLKPCLITLDIKAKLLQAPALLIPIRSTSGKIRSFERLTYFANLQKSLSVRTEDSSHVEGNIFPLKISAVMRDRFVQPSQTNKIFKEERKSKSFELKSITLIVFSHPIHWYWSLDGNLPCCETHPSPTYSHHSHP